MCDTMKGQRKGKPTIERLLPDTLSTRLHHTISTSSDHMIFTSYWSQRLLCNSVDIT
jgi:hypothetical protein